MPGRAGGVRQRCREEAGTSEEIIAWYEDVVQKVLADPDAQQAIADITVIPYYMSAADCAINESTMMETLETVVASLG